MIGWCRGPESNRYGYLYPRDFKSRASASSATSAEVMEATPGIEPGIKVLQTSALPLGYVATHKYKGTSPLINNGAENETRTRDPNLGKVVLYQLSYFRSMVPQHRIELWTQGFSVPCSTD